MAKENRDQLMLEMKESAQQTFQLLENLLEWARSESGHIVYKPERGDLAQIVESNKVLFFNSLKNKNITLVNELKNETFAYFDFNMINTVIRNLINNAIKYTNDNGTITVSAQTDAQNVRISVRDTGIGMDKATEEQLFRIDVKMRSQKGTKGEKGTGLGLILCKEFVEKNKGQIGVKSQQNIGSEFFFTLPKP